MSLVPFKDAKREFIDRFERLYLSELARHRPNLSAMSRAAGLSRRQLRKLLAKHGLCAARDLTPPRRHPGRALSAARSASV